MLVVFVLFFRVLSNLNMVMWVRHTDLIIHGFEIRLSLSQLSESYYEQM